MDDLFDISLSLIDTSPEDELDVHLLEHHPPTLSHELNVSCYVFLFARLLNMDQKESKNLAYASKFHDIGKLNMSPLLLDKVEPFSPQERKVMEGHCVGGYEILQTYPGHLRDLASRIALSHHEDFDGKGYPQRLKGDQIPFECRLCSICDVYDALRKRRSYKEEMNHQNVLDFMTDTSGLAHKFDPDLLLEFSKNHHFFEHLSQKLL